jgi:hypothetical protein
MIQKFFGALVAVIVGYFLKKILLQQFQLGLFSYLVF